MADFFLIFPQGPSLDNTSVSFSWERLNKKGQILSQGKSDTDIDNGLKKEIGRSQVHVILPAEACSVISIPVISQNRKQMLRAAPFAIEEFLLSPIEEMEVVPAKAPVGSRWSVAAIHQSTQAFWREWLKRLDISQATLHPVSCGIQADKNHPVLWVMDETVLFYDGLDLFYQDAANWQVLIQSKDIDWQAVKSLSVWVQDEQNLPNGMLEALKPECQLELHKPERQFKALPSVVDQMAFPVQVRSERSGRNNSFWQKPQLSLALLALLFGVFFIQEAAFVWQLSRLSKDQKQQMVQLYRDSFPQAQTILDPRNQMQQQLLQLQRASGQSTANSLLSQLRLVGPALARSPGIIMGSMRYQRDSLEMDVSARDLEQLDQFRGKLEQSGGFKVALTVTTAGQQGAKGHLKLEPDS